MTESRVLVIEDDLAIRTLITELLRDGGYEVRGASDGAAGLDHLGWPPDVIILDMMMPVMDGPTFLARRREIPVHRDIPVIIVTAGRDAQPEVDEMDISTRLDKPFDEHDLLAAVAAALNGTHSAPSLST